MTGKKRKVRPQPPKWIWLELDGFVKNKMLAADEKIVAKQNKKFDFKKNL